MNAIKNDRRSFLTKFSVGVLSLIGLSSWTGKPKIRVDEADAADPHPVREVKPMGFAWETQDPFLFCVHHEDKFPKGNDELGPAVSLAGRHLGDDFIIKDGWRMYHGKRVPGFPGHPHRGFETITVVRQGMVDHADSMGASGRYGEGDVQWMTAGGGVQHSEMFPLLRKEAENPLELFQIWLNLPKKNKMVPPHFKMLWGSKIPKPVYTDAQGNNTEAEVIAGTLLGQTAPAPPPDSWAADPANEVAVFNLKMAPGATFTLPKTSPGVNRTLYFYKGSQITLSGMKVDRYHSAVVEASVVLPIVNSGAEEARILVLQGKPIGEVVIQYGPFVMNTKEEIQQAFDDYHATKFGGWPWGRYDQVHERTLGRFARHADGTLEQGA
ncbi:MAG: pirin family protein [Saprospiraceae bacterium]|nr:pirin family protein [Saprospiraceae bacterium]